ncbi:MAG TPA: DUF4349 domain-containing protein, partial [Spirochaetota bacterium]|nr:DUF4349 domain-containing protein [Spirochaetota bacterium]
MKQKIFLSCLCIPFLLVACSGFGMQMKGERDEYSSYAAEEPAPSNRESESDAKEIHGGGRTGAARAKKAERLMADKDSEAGNTEGDDNSSRVKDEEEVIIYEADCSVSVKSVKDSVKVVTDLSKEFGGYIDGSTSSDSYRSAIVVVRVPSKKFDSFLNALSRVGARPGSQWPGSDPVTIPWGSGGSGLGCLGSLLRTIHQLDVRHRR